MAGAISSSITAARWPERLLRRLLGLVLTRPALLRAALARRPPGKAVRRADAEAAAPARWHWRRGRYRRRPQWIGRRFSRPRASGECGSRCLPGCAQQVLAPEINEATIRLLTRHGCEVVVAPGQRLLRRAGPPSGRRGAGAGPRPRQYRRLGARFGHRAGSTRSSSTPRAAARWSRITASCCAATRPMPRRRRGSPRWRAT